MRGASATMSMMVCLRLYLLQWPLRPLTKQSIPRDGTEA